MRVLVFSESRTAQIADPLALLSAVKIHQVETDSWTEYGHALFGAIVVIYRSDVDLIITNRGGLLSFLVAVSGSLFGVPVIMRLGGDIWLTNTQRIRETYENRRPSDFVKYTLLYLLNTVTLRIVTGFVVVSEHLKTVLISQRGVDPQAVRVVPSVVVEPASGTNNDPLGSQKSMVVSTVTNFDFRGKYQALRTALPSLVELLVERENLVFVVAGDGFYFEIFEQWASRLARERGVDDRLQFLGYVDDIGSVYYSTDVFVYFSYVDGYPNVVLEAQAAGLPVITNDACGMSEQVTHNESGILIESPEEAASAVVDLLSKEQKRAQLSARARETVSERNGTEHIAAQWDAALNYFVGRIEG